MGQKKYKEYRRDKEKSSDEWYTPKKYIDAVRETLFVIDLDPASSATANQTILAEKIFTEQDNGLEQSWYCNESTSVFCNPPYGKATKLWIQKIITEFELGNIKEAILLVNANTSSKWFSSLWNYALCFTDHRIKFISGEEAIQQNKLILPGIEYKPRKHQPTSGNVFVYFGDNQFRFKKIFEKFGNVVITL